MANTRMYLRCKKCDKQIYLAKYYPGAGWYNDIGDYNETFNIKLEEHVDCDASMFSELFTLEYE